MKQSEAVNILEKMLLSIQHLRSNMVNEDWGLVKSLEDTSDPMVRLLPALYPVLLHPDNVLMEALIKVLDLCHAGNPLEPGTFFNLLMMADREPSIRYMAAMVYHTDIPVADFRLIASGWEEECT